MRLILALFLLMVLPVNAISFEADGYKSGMTKEEIKTSLNNSNLKLEHEAKDSILYSDPLTSRFKTFNFCNNMLILYQKTYEPSMKNFIFLFDELSKKYKKPLHNWSNIKLDAQAGESSSIYYVWQSGNDFIRLGYTVFSSNDQLDVSYETKNKCYNIQY